MSAFPSQSVGKLVAPNRRQSQSDSDASGTSASPTSSSQSDSDVGARELYNWNGTQVDLMKDYFGPTFSRLNQAYLLPTDATEWDRSDKQHIALRLAMGSHYPCPEEVEALLAPVQGKVKTILDIGSGSGRWAIDMAERFPEARVHALDPFPSPVDPATLPRNLMIEIDDANFRMDHFHGRFDVVHMRCVLGGITNIEYTLDQMGRCLKPGGILIWIGADIELTESDGITKKKMKRVEGDDEFALRATPDGSYLQRILYEAVHASVLAGSCLDRSYQRLEEGLWDHPLFDPNTARSGSVALPIGPWAHGDTVEETHLLQYTGLLMRQAFLQFHRGSHGMFRRFNMSEATLQDWSEHADEEINSPEFNAYARLKYCWARRRDNYPFRSVFQPPLPANLPPLPAPPLSTLLAQHPAGAPPIVSLATYRPLQVHRTKAEARADTQRRATGDRCPASLVRVTAAL